MLLIDVPHIAFFAQPEFVYLQLPDLFVAVEEGIIRKNVLVDGYFWLVFVKIEPPKYDHSFSISHLLYWTTFAMRSFPLQHICAFLLYLTTNFIKVCRCDLVLKFPKTENKVPTRVLLLQSIIIFWIVNICFANIKTHNFVIIKNSMTPSQNVVVFCMMSCFDSLMFDLNLTCVWHRCTRNYWYWYQHW